MINNARKISLIQKRLWSFDLESCRLISNWLSHHIKTFEVDIPVINENIQELGFSTRAYNVLKANGIYTIRQLVDASANWDNIRILKGVGKTVEEEIHKKVIDIRKNKLLKQQTKD